MRECANYPETKCLSINYDFGTSGHCELLESIEGHDHKIAQVPIETSHKETSSYGSLLLNVQHYVNLNMKEKHLQSQKKKLRVKMDIYS